MPSTSWGQVEQELWLIYMNKMVQTQRKQSRTQAKCFDFNNKGRCARPYCRYAHKCLKCDNTHAAVNCRNSNSSFMGSNNFRGQTPHQGSISKSENNKSFQNRQFKVISGS